MSSLPIIDARVSATTVWRDALGPGYAVGAAESLLRVTRDAAGRPYRARR
jgi:hypothetical protein